MENVDRGAYSDAVVEVNYILIQQPYATARHRTSNRVLFVGPVNPVQACSQIKRSSA